jgi:hypothetical protein
VKILRTNGNAIEESFIAKEEKTLVYIKKGHSHSQEVQCK